MRILVNARFLLLGRWEGIGLYSLEVLSRLTRAHPEHQFIFAFDRKYDEEFVFAENVMPVVVSPPARHPFLFYCWFEWSIPRIYRQYRCDAFFSPDGFTSLRGSIQHNVLVIHDLAYLHFPQHVGIQMRWYYRRFMPRFVARASQIITISQATYDDITNHFPEASGKTTWCYNGVREIFKPVDAEVRTGVRNKWSAGKPYFLVLGGDTPAQEFGACDASV